MDFKDLVGKLSVLKSYSSLLFPVVLGLIGVLVFIPTQLMSGKLKEQIVKESTSKAREIRSLAGSAVSVDQWKIERDYQDSFKTDANEILTLSRQSSQRELLSYKIFPEPKDTSSLIFDEFSQRFLDGIDGLLTRANALDCPTDAELERILRDSSSSGAGSSSGRRRKTSYRRSKEVEAAIKDAVCLERAETISVYINPSDLVGYEFWQEYEYKGLSEAVEDCWYWQLAYWITEDVIDSIYVMNSASGSVLKSPVKRLLSVGFTREGGISRFRKKAEVDKPSYVLSVDEGLTESCTRRFCNNDIDVVHFNFSVVISTREILSFMEELCSARRHIFKGYFGDEQAQEFKHNQITILESDIRPIDLSDKTHSLCYYGEDAVVELDLICEYIFNKSGYDEIKPSTVKNSLMAPE